MEITAIFEYIFFFIFAFVAVLSAVCVVMLRNPVHCALALMSALLQVAALFLLLRSPFLAAVQIFIYVGAVMVLFLFAVFLLDIRKAVMEVFRPKHRPITIVVLVIIIVELLVVIFTNNFDGLPLTAAADEVTIEVIGRSLFTSYIYPFEIVSVVLLAAMIGAIVMAKEK